MSTRGLRQAPTGRRTAMPSNVRRETLCLLPRAGTEHNRRCLSLLHRETGLATASRAIRPSPARPPSRTSRRETLTGSGPQHVTPGQFPQVTGRRSWKPYAVARRPHGAYRRTTERCHGDWQDYHSAVKLAIAEIYTQEKKHKTQDTNVLS